MKKMLGSCLVLSLLMILGCNQSKPPAQEKTNFVISPGPKASKELQTALLKVPSGGTIELEEGVYSFQRRLSLDTPNVTIKGQGHKKTVLSFKEQKAGSEGLMVSKGPFTIVGLAIEDTKGDALKIKGADNVVIRGVRTEWTQGPNKENGAYGIYPVQCKDVLIEKCVARGASDAGIYVGQSERIIVRNNLVEMNVAGIEIENSRHADVYENQATNNTGGILVFDLPNLPVMGGGYIRVFQNEVIANNHENFAPKGNIVALVPAGTGVMVMANDQVEIFENKIEDNQTTNTAVVSYLISGKKLDDPKYDPFPKKVFIHDNHYKGGGNNPSGEIGGLIAPFFKRVPDILWDGVTNPKGEQKEAVVVLNNNHNATFGNINLLFLRSGSPQVDTNMEKYQGTLPRLNKVELQLSN